MHFPINEKTDIFAFEILLDSVTTSAVGRRGMAEIASKAKTFGLSRFSMSHPTHSVPLSGQVLCFQFFVASSVKI